MQGFDNRECGVAQRLFRAARIALERLRGRPRPVGGTRHHYWFMQNGRRYIYTRLPKNAYSTFVNFIFETSPFRDGSVSDEEKAAFVRKHHMIARAADLRADDVLIFVFRNPVERHVSMFKNKFIAQSGNRTLFRDIGKLTGTEAGSLSSRGFIERVLSPYIGRYDRSFRPVLDIHIAPQTTQLAWARYECAIPFKALHEHAAALFGTDTADQYFSERRNSTAAETYDDDVSEVPADMLRQRYLDTGMLPSKRALLTPDLEAMLEQLYRRDMAMIRKIAG